MYEDVIPIFEKLKSQNKIIVAASRTSQPRWAKDLLLLFDIYKYFDLLEIYPKSKIQHFKRIKEKFDVSFCEMVFFDDEYRNIKKVGELGVKSVYVENGISKKMVEDYL